MLEAEQKTEKLQSYISLVFNALPLSSYTNLIGPPDHQLTKKKLKFGYCYSGEPEDHYRFTATKRCER